MVYTFNCLWSICFCVRVCVHVRVSDPEKTLKEKWKKKGNNINSELYKIENEEAAQHL